MYNYRIFDVINHSSKNRNSDRNDQNEEEKSQHDKNTSFSGPKMTQDAAQRMKKNYAIKMLAFVKRLMLTSRL